MTLEKLKNKLDKLGYRIALEVIEDECSADTLSLIESKELFEVFDPHYGSKVETELAIYVAKKDNNDDDFQIVGFDSTNNIVRVTTKNDVLAFDNTCQYGSRKGNLVEGWDFDREGARVLGYRSTGRYKETM